MYVCACALVWRFTTDQSEIDVEIHLKYVELRQILIYKFLLIWFTLLINSIIFSVAWCTSSSVAVDVRRSDEAWKTFKALNFLVDFYFPPLFQHERRNIHPPPSIIPLSCTISYLKVFHQQITAKLLYKDYEIVILPKSACFLF